MLDQVKKGMLAALGAAVVTQEKLEEVIRDLVRGGELTREQGAKILAELIARGEKAQGDVGRIAAELGQKLAKWQPVTRGDFDALDTRVAALERRLGVDPEPSCGSPGPAA